ncbi:UNVERIFIED_CONTAM: hypothetical protein LK11_20195 [Mumia flava]
MASTRTRGRDRDPRPRPVVLLVLLAAVALITLDLTGAGGPVRTVASTVLGPFQGGVARVMEPFGLDVFADRTALEDENVRLEEENASLRRRLASTGVDAQRLGEYDRLARYTREADLRTVQAAVVAYGPGQSFRRTVTIDAGTADGVRVDMTVVAADGLVGRVLVAGRSHATVLLLADAESRVGARLGSDAELGMLSGDGDLSGAGRLTLTLLDGTVEPDVGDTVVSWGSPRGVPYIAGVPIGRVERTTFSPREQSTEVTVAPFVDASSLDVVAVVTGIGRER